MHFFYVWRESTVATESLVVIGPARKNKQVLFFHVSNLFYLHKKRIKFLLTDFMIAIKSLFL